MSKLPGGHMPRAASRLDAELMSKGPQRQSDSHSPRLTADCGRLSADSSSTVDSSLDPSSMDASQA